MRNRAPPSRSHFPGLVGPPSRPAIPPWLPSSPPVRVGLSTSFSGVENVGTLPARFRPAWLPSRYPPVPSRLGIPTPSFPPRTPHTFYQPYYGRSHLLLRFPLAWVPAAPRSRGKSLHVVPADPVFPQYSPPHFHLILLPMSMALLTYGRSHRSLQFFPAWVAPSRDPAAPKTWEISPHGTCLAPVPPRFPPFTSHLALHLHQRPGCDLDHCPLLSILHWALKPRRST